MTKQVSKRTELPPTRSYEDIAVGEKLPELVIELTPTLIIAGAIASDDFEDVHHDRDAAQRRGTKDIFMNILTTNGLVGRYVTDWAGPEALLLQVAIRLGAPNYAYDTMRLNGEVRVKEQSEGRGIVGLDVKGANSIGDHVVASVRLALPNGTARP